MVRSNRTALLTIRAWCEEDSQDPLRVEIRVADDVGAGFRSTVTTIHTEAVVDAVRAFLDTVACNPSDRPAAMPPSRPDHA